jgi:hypothetical protein
LLAGIRQSLTSANTLANKQLQLTQSQNTLLNRLLGQTKSNAATTNTDLKKILASTRTSSTKPAAHPTATKKTVVSGKKGTGVQGSGQRRFGL